MIEEILELRADYTVQKAIDLLPGLERAMGSAEVARFENALRAAGLPATATRSPGLEVVTP